MPILYRPARETDLAPAQELITSSINDLTRRHGFGAIAAVRPPTFQLHALADDPRGLWIAEDESRILGAAFSWLCGDLWFLAELFIDPATQGAGVGGQLLSRVFAQADAASAKSRALITFAFNTVSQGLYARHGLYPRLPLLMLSGDRATAAAALPATQLHSERIEDIDALAAALDTLDIGALGISRAKHRRLLFEDPAMTGYVFRRGKACIGSAWIAGSGHVGPLAAASREDMAEVLAAALAIAVRGQSKRVSALVPGHSESALALAMQAGMRMTLPMVLASNRDFGDWRLYLPRSPIFM